MTTSSTARGESTEPSPRRTAAIAAAVGFIAIASFQVALALGAPLGSAAWGGTYVQLPMGLRIASAIAVVVWTLAALVILGRAGFRVAPLPPGILRWGPWILVGLTAVGALVNLASPSGWERFMWGPVALALAILSFVVARSPRVGGEG